MSLQVWLPLIKDFKNCGLSDLQFVQDNLDYTVSASNGKIGSTCFYNSSNTAGGLISDKKINLGTKLSMCCWFKFSSLMAASALGAAMGGQHRYPTSTGMGLTMKYISDTTGYLSCNTGTGGGDSNRTYNTYCNNTLLSANTWYHVCFTYDGNTIRFYLDGNPDGEHSFTGQVNVEDYVHVFTWSSDDASYNKTVHPNYKLNGYMNDFRIYDHVLSKKEVKYIAHGLVAHYQLKGMGATNYLKGASQFTEDNPLVRNANDVSHMNDSYVYHSGMSATIPTAGTYTFVVNADGNPTGHPTSGTSASSRYFSLWLQHQSTGDHYHFSGTTGADGRCYGTQSLPAGNYTIRTNLYAADNVNYTIKFWNMKIIQGNYNPSDTYCPHEEDELYTALRVDSAIWADASGYDNTLTQVGTVPVVSGSARYGSCIDFNQTGYLKKDDFNMTTDQFTIAFWANCPGSTNAQHFICGTFNNWTHNGFGMWRDANGTGYSALLKSDAESSYTGLPSYSINNATWDHIAYVYTGTAGILYKNGEEVARVTGGKNGAVYHPNLYIGNSLYSNAPASETDESSMSDFRFYATALSSEDVANLAKVSASAEKNGNFYAYDFHENKRNTIDRDGVAATGGFNVRQAPTYDMKIQALGDGSTWARMHNLDLTSDKTFFGSAPEVSKCLNKYNRYSRVGMVDKYKSDNKYEFMLTYPSMKKTVPAGYTQLEYIEATGTQYINTGVSTAARWEFDIQFTPSDSRQLMGYSTSGWMYWGAHDATSYELEGQVINGVTTGERHTIVHDFTNKLLTIQDIDTKINTTNAPDGTYTIFSLGSGFTCCAKLYRCKCVQDGSLIRDFIPAMRNSDGAIGLVDVSNNVFYGNAGSGVFFCNYTWLDYIESTGTQYIDTGVVMSATHGLKGEMVSMPSTNTIRQMYGVYESPATFGFGYGSSSLRFEWGSSKRTTITEAPYSEPTTYKVEHNYLNSSVIRVNDIDYGATSRSGGTLPLYIFASNENGVASRFSNTRIKSLQITEGNTIVRDFKPCIVSGQVGMYDIVTKTFYGNSGSGSFRAGYKGGDYQWIDYIQNNGTEYIDTGYPAPEGFICEAVLEYVTLSGGYVLGSHNIESPWGRNGFGVNGNQCFELGTGDTCPASSFKVALNTKYTIKASSVKGDSYLDVNGTRAISTTDSSSRCTGNIFVFRNQYEINRNSSTSNIKLYSLKFWLPNGTLIRDFVPCISPSGQVGLYDKVTKRFFGNRGSGYLVAGTTKESLPLYNRWIQTSSPTATSVSGFKPLSTSWPAHNAGIRRHGSACQYNCDSGDTWFAPIGQYTIWEGGIPAADGTMQLQTELWVRTDRLPKEDEFRIFDGAMTATEFFEI